MSPRLLCALGLLSAATATPAEIVVSANPRHLTCTTEAAQWDSRVLESLAPGNRMAGRIRMIGSVPHPRYPAGAGFLLAVPRTRGTTLGVQLGLFPNERDRLTVGLRVPKREQIISVAQVPLGAWIPVSAALSERGVLEVTVAGHTVRRRVRARRGLVPFLMCNSGSFEFELDEGMVASPERFEARPN